MSSIHRKIITALACLSACVAMADEPNNLTLLTEPQAMSMVLIQLNISDDIITQPICIELVKNGREQDAPTVLGESDLRGQIASLGRSREGRHTLIVPVFWSSSGGLTNTEHPVASEGIYSIRLIAPVTNSDSNSGRIYYEAETRFSKPSPSDLRFFKLAQGKQISSLILKHNTTEEAKHSAPYAIGLGLIAHIVRSTQNTNDPTHGNTEWAEPLYELAFAVPESSYSPYLAYYSACSFMWQKKSGFIKRTYGYDLPNARIANLEHYTKALKSLEFAAEHGDPYIQPLAMCFLSLMKAWGEDFDGAEKLLKEIQAKNYVPAPVPAMANEIAKYIELHRSSNRG